MKKFMERYSYESVHLFLNQVAIALFGLTLALAAGMAESFALSVVTSVFAVLFFLILQYNTMWKVGANDRLSDDLGKIKVSYSVPFWMWLLSNSLNLLLALLFAVGKAVSSVDLISSVGGVAAVINLIVQGMYTGLLTIDVGGAPLNTYWFMHFVITIPALAVGYLAYLLGSRNIKLLAPLNKEK
ncbi:MAG: hypothetical protein E7649_03930 [Ruminococcaceae bacterium]|nr:hypothetical protein [Oscillospiraceae bacterium]